MPALSIDSTHLSSLAGVRIIFGHQSVGANLLQGVQSLSAAVPIIALDETTAADSSVAGIHHFRIGRNEDPLAKIDHFRRVLIDRGLGAGAAVAGMKFCYADFERRTDVDAVFTRYREAMTDIRQRYPRLTLLHVTVPLTVRDRSLKGRLRELLHGDADNAARGRFNTLLRNHFATDPVFDLARLESTTPDGGRVASSCRGTPCYSLYPGYSSDEGHLNAAGSRRIAAGFLSTIIQATAH